MRGKFVVLISGLPSSGKTTLAHELRKSFKAFCENALTLIDGDEVRKNFYPELGFEKADRLKNLEFISGLALNEVLVGRSVICSTIAPYREGRIRFIEKLETTVPVFLIYMSTPLKVCEGRDSKGLFSRARNGEIANFTGINSPYETPVNPDFIIDSSVVSNLEIVQNMTQEILNKLNKEVI